MLLPAAYHALSFQIPAAASGSFSGCEDHRGCPCMPGIQIVTNRGARQMEKNSDPPDTAPPVFALHLMWNSTGLPADGDGGVAAF